MGAVSFLNIMFKPYLQLHLKTFHSKNPSNLNIFLLQSGELPTPKPTSLRYMLSRLQVNSPFDTRLIPIQKLKLVLIRTQKNCRNPLKTSNKDIPNSDSFLNYYVNNHLMSCFHCSMNTTHCIINHMHVFALNDSTHVS